MSADQARPSAAPKGGQEALARAISAGPDELCAFVDASLEGLTAVGLVFTALAHRALGSAPDLADFSAYGRVVAGLCAEHTSPLSPLVAEALLRLFYRDVDVTRNISGELMTSAICSMVYSTVRAEGLDAGALVAEVWEDVQAASGQVAAEVARLSAGRVEEGPPG
jgi:hypothetical protein